MTNRWKAEKGEKGDTAFSSIYFTAVTKRVRGLGYHRPRRGPLASGQFNGDRSL